MPRIVLASALSRWLPQASRQASGQSTGEVTLEIEGASVGEALDSLFGLHPGLRGYVVDEHGAVRHHVAVFVDGDAITDKRALNQAVGDDSEVYVMQALSGG